MEIIAGALNRRIQVQAQSMSTNLDAFGQPTAASWSTIYRCWASIDVQGSQLINQPEEFISETIVRITIRWTSSVIFDASQRIVYTEPTTNVVHTYQIKTVTNPKQANKDLMILCYELHGKE
jgi:head-tail adaptor